MPDAGVQDVEEALVVHSFYVDHVLISIMSVAVSCDVPPEAASSAAFHNFNAHFAPFMGKPGRKNCIRVIFKVQLPQVALCKLLAQTLTPMKAAWTMHEIDGVKCVLIGREPRRPDAGSTGGSDSGNFQCVVGAIDKELARRGCRP